MSHNQAAALFTAWVYYLAWLNQSGHQPMSFPEYRRLHHA